MSTPKSKSVDVALDLTKQLITLSSALIPASIALLGLRFPSGSGRVVPLAVITWILFSSITFLISVVFGLAVNAGAVAELRKSQDYDVTFKPSVAYPSMLQWVSFVLGVILMTYALNLALSN